jgi:hypothetical protein
MSRKLNYGRRSNFGLISMHLENSRPERLTVEKSLVRGKLAKTRSFGKK